MSLSSLLISTPLLFVFALYFWGIVLECSFEFLSLTTVSAFSIRRHQHQYLQRHQSISTKAYSTGGLQEEIEQESTGTVTNEFINDFERSCTIHTTIQELRAQLPTLLTEPVTEELAETIYEENFQLTVASTATSSTTRTSRTTFKTRKATKSDTEGNDETAATTTTTTTSNNSDENDDIVLVSSREELMSLSNTLVIATRAATQANALISTSFVGGGGANDDKTETATTTRINCELTMDPSMQSIQVFWQTTLPSLPAAPPQSPLTVPSGNDFRRKMATVEGLSLFNLDANSGKIRTHRLLQVRWNDQLLNARAIGQQLASLRQVALSLQKSPLVQSLSSQPVLGALFNQVKQDWIEQTATTRPKTEQPKDLPELYVVESIQQTLNHRNNFTLSNSTNNRIPINDYRLTSPSFSFSRSSSSSSILPPPLPSPFPGSDHWNKYVATYRTGNKFIQNVIPILSGKRTINSQEMAMAELFANNCTLISVDGSLLLQGRDSVAKFYQNLASLRRRSGLLSDWTLQRAVIVSNWDNGDNGSEISNDEVCIKIDYVANTTTFPGVLQPVSIQGTDKFVLYQPPLLKDDDKEEDDEEILIKRVEQVNVLIGGVQDNFGFMKSMTTALDNTGRFGIGIGDSAVMEMLQRAVVAGGGRSTGEVVVRGTEGKQTRDDKNNNDQSAPREKKKKGRVTAPPRLADSVATRVYGIMSQLHRDVIPSLAYSSSGIGDAIQSSPHPFVYHYMTQNIELRGYLGETLVRGFTSYNRVIRTVLTSWRTALANGSVKVSKTPSVTVELTAKGSIRLIVILNLKVYPIPSSNGNSGGGGTVGGAERGGPSFPVTIAVTSDYVIEKETGLIYQHRLVESRVNGQLTPGDVISRWIRRRGGTPAEGNGESDENMILRALTDAVTWVRSVGSPLE